MNRIKHVTVGAGTILAAMFASALTVDIRSAEPLTAAGKPAEGPWEVFLGEPHFQSQTLFEGGDGVREPYLAVALDGTVLALRNYVKHLRRSEDGGQSWGDIIEVPFGFHPR